MQENRTMSSKISRNGIMLTCLISMFSSIALAQDATTTDLTGQDVSIEQLVAALDIPTRGVDAKCAPYQQQMSRLTRGVASVPKTAEEVPAIEPMKTASVSATFELNSDALTAGAASLLETVAEALNTPELSAQCFQLAGHTCDLGDDTYNLDLSKRRADAVKAFLIGHGVDENRLVTTGFGETSPLVPNETEATRQKNRRVDLGALAPPTIEYE
jgi:outer membrane protein OmpA-like peptidoglycan-associated protein